MIGGNETSADTAKASVTTDAQKLADFLIKSVIERKSVFLIGNGGSAANANHIENDLVKISSDIRSLNPEMPPVNVQSLCSNQAVLTCIANDYGYERIFEVQLIAKATAGDYMIILSGSGNSPNILRACQHARSKGINTFGIIGEPSGKAIEWCNSCTEEFPRIMQASEDYQLAVSHQACAILEHYLRKSLSN